MCFRLACSNGRREILEYLISTFGLTREDVCCLQNDALKHALCGGVEIVEYLITSYGITKEEFLACKCLSSVYGIKMLQYLQGLFSFTKEEILSDEFSLFRHACEGESTEMAAHLLDTYKITKEDFDVTGLIVSLQKGDPNHNSDIDNAHRIGTPWCSGFLSVLALKFRGHHALVMKNDNRRLLCGRKKTNV
ncbi:hypothetical protein Pelo_17402 [Pelomyxa schiedti]|nr:hypothetical protein Pelo_17402 [Pelomyxa schiedti]